MLKELCKERRLMNIFNENEESWEECRERIINLLCNEEYGFIPKECDRLSFETVSEEANFCAGKVTLKKIAVTARFGTQSFSFPIYSSIPNTDKKHPFFVHINFRDNVPDRYLPVEEICDRGFAVLSFCYQDISVDNVRTHLDNGRYNEGLNDIMFNDIIKQNNHCGKIALWARAASLVMDYAKTLDCLDFNNATVVGHSRLGKTALLAGALDTRFTCAISNCSGSSGAAISRMKKGESVKAIVERTPYWFCENYKKYIDREDELPFDQHFLIAAMAPRKVYVASAVMDEWSDPVSEFLSCFMASEVYEKLGLKGLQCLDRLPEAGDSFHDGYIGYHMRQGTHYFSREDWNKFMDFLSR